MTHRVEASNSASATAYDCVPDVSLRVGIERVRAAARRRLVSDDLLRLGIELAQAVASIFGKVDFSVEPNDSVGMRPILRSRWHRPFFRARLKIKIPRIEAKDRIRRSRA